MGDTPTPPPFGTMMRRRMGWRAVVAAVLLLAWGGATASGAVAPGSWLEGYAAEAVRLRAYTATRLAYYGGASDCAGASHVAYARGTADPQIVDAWYVALQVSADAALVGLGAAEYLCE